MPSDASSPPAARHGQADGVGLGPVTDDARRASDAVVARAYAFLAAALAGDSAPPRPALAAELASVLGTQSLVVLHTADDVSETVISYGFGRDPAADLGQELVARAIADGMPVRDDRVAAGLVTRLVVPAMLGGRPWGVLGVASALPDAFDDELVERVVELAGGLAVVLSPLVSSSGFRRGGERRLREGLEAVITSMAGMGDETPPTAAAKILAEVLHREFQWPRVLLLAERSELGALPIAVAGDDIRAGDLSRPRRPADDGMPAEVPGQSPSTAAGQPFFEGSVSRMEVGLRLGAYAPNGSLVVESPDPDAFDEVDAQLARHVAGLAGPLLGRLARHDHRRAVESRADHVDQIQRRKFVSLAHELRTPLTVMIGYADLLAMPGPDSDQRQAYGATLARHARALGRMVDNALVTWQLDEGTLEIASRPISMRDAVLDAIEALGSNEFSGDGVAEVMALADAFWFPRVIQALLDNARRFVPEAAVQITAVASNGLVRLAVHDDGPGIAHDELVHIFDAFHRGEDGGTGPQRGVGLGLTVARELTRAMGGELEAASAPGYGTTFTVTLAAAAS